jgi:8-oxo-dGTP pyrophosphatase MutT (NUDIX family)
MSFYLSLGFQIQSNDFDSISRNAAKGVVGHPERMLMIKTYRHDYKFPGGGVKTGEDLLKALSREIKEETGFSVVNTGDEVGVVYEKRVDIMVNPDFDTWLFRDTQVLKLLLESF